jgi:hypothetical protein
MDGNSEVNNAMAPSDAAVQMIVFLFIASPPRSRLRLSSYDAQNRPAVTSNSFSAGLAAHGQRHLIVGKDRKARVVCKWLDVKRELGANGGSKLPQRKFNALRARTACKIQDLTVTTAEVGGPIQLTTQKTAF